MPVLWEGTDKGSNPTTLQGQDVVAAAAAAAAADSIAPLLLPACPDADPKPAPPLPPAAAAAVPPLPAAAAARSPFPPALAPSPPPKDAALPMRIKLPVAPVQAGEDSGPAMLVLPGVSSSEPLPVLAAWLPDAAAAAGVPWPCWLLLLAVSVGPPPRLSCCLG